MSGIYQHDGLVWFVQDDDTVWVNRGDPETDPWERASAEEARPVVELAATREVFITPGGIRYTVHEGDVEDCPVCRRLPTDSPSGKDAHR